MARSGETLPIANIAKTANISILDSFAQRAKYRCLVSPNVGNVGNLGNVGNVEKRWHVAYW